MTTEKRMTRSKILIAALTTLHSPWLHYTTVLLRQATAMHVVRKTWGHHHHRTSTQIHSWKCAKKSRKNIHNSRLRHFH